MSDIYFNFDHTDSLQGMAPPDIDGDGFGNASLPSQLAGQGMYIIANVETNNRYVGISTDLARRFKDRLPTVTELGLSSETMSKIVVWWGQVAIKNSGENRSTNVTSYRGPLNVMLDNVSVNLERLLVRFVLTHLTRSGDHATVSNNVYAKESYMNETGHAVTVHFVSARNSEFDAYNDDVVWGVNESW